MNRSLNRSLRSKKKVAVTYGKKNSKANVSQLITTATIKNRNKNLQKNNKLLAQALEESRGEAANYLKVIQDLTSENSNVQLARQKLKHMAGAIQLLVTELSEVMTILDTKPRNMLQCFMTKDLRCPIREPDLCPIKETSGINSSDSNMTSVLSFGNTTEETPKLHKTKLPDFEMSPITRDDTTEIYDIQALLSNAKDSKPKHFHKHPLKHNLLRPSTSKSPMTPSKTRNKINAKDTEQFLSKFKLPFKQKTPSAVSSSTESQTSKIPVSVQVHDTPEKPMKEVIVNERRQTFVVEHEKIVAKTPPAAAKGRKKSSFEGTPPSPVISCDRRLLAKVLNKEPFSTKTTRKSVAPENKMPEKELEKPAIQSQKRGTFVLPEPPKPAKQPKVLEVQPDFAKQAEKRGTFVVPESVEVSKQVPEVPEVSSFDKQLDKRGTFVVPDTVKEVNQSAAPVSETVEVKKAVIEPIVPGIEVKSKPETNHVGGNFISAHNETNLMPLDMELTEVVDRTIFVAINNLENALPAGKAAVENTSNQVPTLKVSPSAEQTKDMQKPGTTKHPADNEIASTLIEKTHTDTMKPNPEKNSRKSVLPSSSNKGQLDAIAKSSSESCTVESDKTANEKSQPRPKRSSISSKKYVEPKCDDDDDDSSDSSDDDFLVNKSAIPNNIFHSRKSLKPNRRGPFVFTAVPKKRDSVKRMSTAKRKTQGKVSVSSHPEENFDADKAHKGTSRKSVSFAIKQCFSAFEDIDVPGKTQTKTQKAEIGGDIPVIFTPTDDESIDDSSKASKNINLDFKSTTAEIEHVDPKKTFRNSKCPSAKATVSDAPIDGSDSDVQQKKASRKSKFYQAPDSIELHTLKPRPSVSQNTLKRKIDPETNGNPEVKSREFRDDIAPGTEPSASQKNHVDSSSNHKSKSIAWTKSSSTNVSSKMQGEEKKSTSVPIDDVTGLNFKDKAEAVKPYNKRPAPSVSPTKRKSSKNKGLRPLPVDEFSEILIADEMVQNVPKRPAPSVSPTKRKSSRKKTMDDFYAILDNSIPQQEKNAKTKHPLDAEVKVNALGSSKDRIKSHDEADSQPDTIHKIIAEDRAKKPTTQDNKDVEKFDRVRETKQKNIAKSRDETEKTHKVRVETEHKGTVNSKDGTEKQQVHKVQSKKKEIPTDTVEKEMIHRVHVETHKEKSREEKPNKDEKTSKVRKVLGEIAPSNTHSRDVVTQELGDNASKSKQKAKSKPPQSSKKKKQQQQVENEVDEFLCEKAAEFKLSDFPLHPDSRCVQSIGEMFSKDSDILDGRKSKRARVTKSYKEPSLNVKMRRK